eukprot:785496-Prymnesium_polylepis.1
MPETDCRGVHNAYTIAPIVSLRGGPLQLFQVSGQLRTCPRPPRARIRVGVSRCSVDIRSSKSHKSANH